MRTLAAILSTLLLSGVCAPRSGAKVYHSNGSAAHVQTLHNYYARDGDTIVVPVGTFRWSTGVTISRAITLQGRGIGKTIIKDGIGNNTGRLIHFTLAPGKASRLTGIEFQDGGRRAAPLNGFMGVLGSNIDGRTMRIDHCKFNNVKGVINFQTVIGVADHNTIITRANGFFAFRNSYWNGASSAYGDASRSAPINFGSSEFFFTEDNIYRGMSPAATNTITDGYAGARFVVRHNNIIDGAIGAHGTDSTGRERGVAAMEIYNNRFTQTSLSKGASWGHARGGVTLLHDNTISGFGPDPFYPLICYRMFWSFWYGADGTNPWDINKPGGPFFSGTAAVATGRPIRGLTKVTVSGSPNWTTNQWAGYTIKRTTNLGRSTSKAYFSEIQSNTSNTLTYLPGWTSNLTLAAGDSFQLWKVEQALDQSGVSGGQLLTIGPIAQTPSPPTRPPSGWNDQVITPCYSWNNTREDGAHVNFGRASRLFKEGVHYFNDTAMPGYSPFIYPHPLTLLPVGTPRAVIRDFDGDSSPDYVLRRASTQQTGIYYLDNNVYAGSAGGSTLPLGWDVVAAADFNGDGHSDYLLYNASIHQTGIYYLHNNAYVGSAWGPTLPPGWDVVAAADFNGDGHSDYLLYNVNTQQTGIYYLDNNVYVGSALGPTLPPVFTLVGTADFNRDAKPDYLLYDVNTQQTGIYYLDNNVYVGSAWGPTLPPVFTLVGAADFNRDAKPDYLLYDVNTQQTGIYYLDNNVYAGSAWGPTTAPGWSLFGRK